MRLRLASTVALSVSVVVSCALASSALARPQTTAPTVLVKVKVTITDSKIIMHPKRAPRGANVLFTLRNVGKRAHVFTLGNAKRGVGLQAGFRSTVRPGKRKTLLLYLDYRGLMPYYGSTPGGGKRMYGKFLIGEGVAGGFVG